ncbi:hypothetical protein VTG60DRAFT_2956 [Thermothelomyces hinnuleus]
MNGTRKEYLVTYRVSLTPVKVIDDFLPSFGLHATWPFKERAQLGNVVDPRKLRDELSIALHDMQVVAAADSAVKNQDKDKNKKVTYVIVLIDPDAPSRERPEWGEFCHWVASGTLAPPAVGPPPPPGGTPKARSRARRWWVSPVPTFPFQFCPFL